MALGVELALGDGFGVGALQAARLAASIPVTTNTEAILLMFMRSPIF